MRIQKIVIFSACMIIGGWYLYNYSLNSSYDPVAFEQRFNQANQLLLGGRNDDAIGQYEQLLKQNASFPAVYFNLGRAYANKKEWDNAIEAFQAALDLKPAFADMIHFHAGMASFNKDELHAAQEHFLHVLELKPDNGDAWYYLGMIAQKSNALEQAAEYYYKAATCNKQFLQLLLSVATALRDQKQFDKAIAVCLQALNIEPNHYYAHLMLGDIANMQGNQDEAIKQYQKACDANRDCFEAFNNLGTLYAGQQGDNEKALPYLQQALKIKPDHAGARAGLSAMYLAQGDYERGLQEYECRLSTFFEPHPREFQKPRWDGKEKLNNKTILLYAEQGLGDTLQFIRYAKMLQEKGARVIVETQKPLVKLLSMCPYIDSVIAAGAPLPDYDLRAPLMSLPYLCKTRLKTIPSQIPYVFADAGLEKEWQQKLQNKTQFKIGICWHVEPSHDSDVFRGSGKTISIAGCKRSVPLELFVPLAKIKNVKLYSLQKHNGVEELQKIAPGLIYDFGDELDNKHGSFMDTAAIMKQLDLVITADTSVAHLAGALGVPVWVMLPFPSDWRWLQNRVDTPWYPSMKLFRKQRGDNDWGRVMHAVETAVKQKLHVS